MLLSNYDSKNFSSLRKQYGQSLVKLGEIDESVIALDAEVSNSTFSYLFKERFPERFIECYIAEQNMISVALGLSLRGKKPFVSTFGAFLTRAFDQIRMAQYSKANLKITGTHCGVHIGEDGPSQMALEDLAMIRSVNGSKIFYPSDINSLNKMMAIMLNDFGISYLRVTRGDLPNIYQEDEKFAVGGSKTLKESDSDEITLIGAGVTLHQSITAAIKLQKQNINCRVIDLYSIKPIDYSTILKALAETKAIIVTEDHYREGGIYSAIMESLAGQMISKPIYHLCVNKTPRSGKPEELLEYEEIDAQAIVSLVNKII
jgi:transketolase